MALAAAPFLPLSSEIISSLSQDIQQAEQQGSLTQTQLQIVFEQKWFLLFVPKEWGGLEASLPDALRLEEALAAIDGSLGWTVTLCSGAGFFVGYLDPELSRSLCNDKQVCFGGSGGVTGIAKRNKNGYEVTGYWKYATGSPHNSVFTANCHIEKDGKLITDDAGKPIIQSFLFLKEEVVIHKTWQMVGLKATASHAFEVKNLQVDKNRSFIISANHTTLPNPVYTYPFLPFAESTLAVNFLGMAEHFAKECLQIVHNSESRILLKETLLEKAIHGLTNLKTDFYSAVETSWQAHLKKEEKTELFLKEVSRTSRALAKESRQFVDNLYPLCGMMAARESSNINRIWRDIHTASQHSLLAG